MDWLKDTIAQFITWLGSKITGVVDWFLSLVKTLLKWFVDLALAVFKAAWDMLTDLVCWIIDKMLGLVVKAVDALDLSGLSGFSPGSDLPGEIINVMQLCGVGTAVSIIAAAIAVRLVLQLIPFTRLGS